MPVTESSAPSDSNARFERQDSNARFERQDSKGSTLAIRLTLLLVALLLVSLYWFWLRGAPIEPDDGPVEAVLDQGEDADVSARGSAESASSSESSIDGSGVSEPDPAPVPLVISEPLIAVRPGSTELPEALDTSGLASGLTSGLAFSPDGGQLAWWADGSAWRIPLASAQEGSVEALLGAVGGVTALAWDAESSRWLTGDVHGRLRIWGLLEGGDGSDPDPHFEMRLTGLEGPVTRVDWSGQLMACAAGGHIWLWQGDGRRLVATWQAHETAISFLSFRRDGKALLSADEGGGLRLWNAAGRLLEDYSEIQLGSVQAAGFDPFGFVVAWARQGSDALVSGEGSWGLWREAGGWWFPQEPSNGPVRVTLADDGSYLLWKSDEGFLLKLRDEQILALSGLHVGANPVLSPGGHQLAWLDESKDDHQKAFVVSLLPEVTGSGSASR